MIETYINKEDGSVLYVLYGVDPFSGYPYYIVQLFKDPELTISLSLCECLSICPELYFTQYNNIYSLIRMRPYYIRVLVKSLNAKHFYIKGKACKKLHPKASYD